MSLKDLPTLSFAEALDAVTAAVTAGVTPFLFGPPGIGKTSLANQLGKRLDKPVLSIILSNYEATDIAGLPVQKQERIERVLFGAFEEAAKNPTILFLDEITCIPKSVEGPALRLALEKVAGEVPLHEESAIIMAGNDPAQAPGGRSLSSALTNRVIVLNMSPTVYEVREFFTRHAVGVVQPEFLDFAATLSVRPELLEMTPPTASIDNGAPWGSPRAWQLGLQAYARLMAMTTRESAAQGKAGAATKEGFDPKVGLGDRLAYTVLAGAVGVHGAGAYLILKHLRNELPSMDEIIANPNAPLPTTAEHAIALVGLLARVSMTHPLEAHRYLHRLPDEYTETFCAAASLVIKNSGDIGAFLAKYPQGFKDYSKTLQRLSAIQHRGEGRIKGLSELENSIVQTAMARAEEVRATIGLKS